MGGLSIAPAPGRHEGEHRTTGGHRLVSTGHHVRRRMVGARVRRHRAGIRLAAAAARYLTALAGLAFGGGISFANALDSASVGRWLLAATLGYAAVLSGVGIVAVGERGLGILAALRSTDRR